MTFHHADLVDVLAWGRLVGAVVEDPSRPGYFVFEYAEDWVGGGIELAPLHMPTRSGETYSFPELDRSTFWGLPGLLADALPDRFGNALINARLREEGVDAGDITALDRLAYTADRGMGALEFFPPIEPTAPDPTVIELADLVVASRSLVEGRPGDDRATADALAQLISVGTSAGGARPKAVIAYNVETGQIRSGQVEVPEGFEPWIIKLDGVDGYRFGPSQDTGRIEYAYSLMAGAAGIDMAECRLHREFDRAHFMTRRFDRGSDGAKVHAQTLCALDHLDYNLLPGAHGYGQYLAVIDALDLGAAAREEGFRRMVFNVAGANRDDHTKNLSFLADEQGRWRLAPAYDVTHSHADGVGVVHHRMSIDGKTTEIAMADLLTFADRWEVPAPDEAITQVLTAVDAWGDFAGAAGVPAADIDRIRADLDRSRPT